MKTKKSTDWLKAALCGFGLLAVASGTGCQVTVGGQTLPSAYYFSDDVQYFAPGPDFKLSKEASAMKAYNADQRMLKR